jgi:tRNA G18 (ribose-2'-O)-methylase SpoU
MFHSLKICASFVENPMNLGALCRTAEVFGLESLVLPDLAIAQSHEFRKLAASAHHWQPLEACPPDQVCEWIEQQRRLDYGVFALTRHPQAHCLAEFVFPQKTALVLGRELTGIPEDVVQTCVQRAGGAIAIPQFGRVESLNVHTAAAIAIYEFVKQHALQGDRPYPESPD